MSIFALTGRFTKGYSPEQVNRFFAHAKATYEDRLSPGTPAVTAEQARSVGFDLVRGGYDMYQVDTALDRLADTLTHHERDALRREHGDEHVIAEARRRGRELAEQLRKDRKSRFEHPENRDEGYAAEDVDDLGDNIVAYLRGEIEMSPDDVRHAMFSTARGQKAYRKPQVDAFLDRVVTLMVLSDSKV